MDVSQRHGGLPTIPAEVSVVERKWAAVIGIDDKPLLTVTRREWT